MKRNKDAYNEKYFIKRYHRTFNNRFDLNHLRYRQIIRIATEEHVETAVDIGCGLGTISWALSQHCFVIGIDFSKFAVHTAKRFYSCVRSLSLQFILCSALQLPFRHNFADCIVCSHFFEHLTERDAKIAQKELWETLRRGGRFILDQPLEETFTLPMTFDRLGIRIAKKLKLGNEKRMLSSVDKDWTHIRRYSLDQIVTELLENKFRRLKFSWNSRSPLLLLSIPFALCSLLKRKKHYIKLYLRTPEFFRKLFFWRPDPIIVLLK